MAETTWSEEAVEPPRKKGVPTWVWGCGGGCLVMLVLAIALGVWGFGQVKQAIDPDVVWPKVAEHLPFDERPAGYQPFGSEFGGGGGFMIRAPSKGLMGVLVIAPGEDPEELERFFSGDEKGGVAGVGEIREPEPLSIEVQGREVRALRYGSDSAFGGGDHEGGPGRVVMVDLSGDSGQPFVMLQVIREGGGDTTPEDVQSFLEPFDPWGERGGASGSADDSGGGSDGE